MIDREDIAANERAHTVESFDDELIVIMKLQRITAGGIASNYRTRRFCPTTSV